MTGNFYIIYDDYGYITGSDGNTYYYRNLDFVRFSKYQIQEGDAISFDIAERKQGTKYDRAINIHKLSVSSANTQKTIVSPGINPSVHLDHFTDDERNIILNTLRNVFYVSNGGQRIPIDNSEYRYCYIKPTEYFTTMFHLERELVVVFSDYVDFLPRTTKVAPYVYSHESNKIRLDRCCHIIISNDSNIETKLRSLTKDTNQNAIIIPFSYHEILSHKLTEDGIKERFKTYLFDVDLFSESQPIEDDLFFFGRRDYVQGIANKCKTHTPCGIFGLRRSGKTSLLYAVRRLLSQEDYLSIYIPCNSELANLDWKMALYRIAKDVYIETGKKGQLHREIDYTDEKKASMYFEDDLYSCLRNMSKPITLMFDEIEYITFKSEMANATWKDGTSFISLWNALLGYCHKRSEQISIVIAGTNPMINEVPSILIGDVDQTNPMYGQLAQSNQSAYLPLFDIKSTETMINTLGGYMGISFSEDICAQITQDCGGHPFFIRLLCKFINQYTKTKHMDRPITITKAIYEKARPEFEKSPDAQGFYSMILLILKECFEKEYNVLKILATTNDKQISATQDQNSLLHLIGYGLVDSNNGNYAIKFETVKRFLRGTYQFEVEGLSAKQKNREINLRVSEAESTLRRLIKQMLLLLYGETKAKEIVIQGMIKQQNGETHYVSQARKLEYSKLFDPSVNPGLFLSVLVNIICDNYSVFGNLFSGESVVTVQHNLETINKARRAPAHSYDDNCENWSEKEFTEFRKAMSWLEEKLQPFRG